MKKQKELVLILLSIFAIILITATLVQAQTYQQVTTITGTSSQTSNYFNVPTSEWRISWSFATSTPTYSAFSFKIYKEGDTIPISAVVAPPNQFSHITYEHNSQPGNYCIQTYVADLISYTITIEAQQTTTPTPTPVTPEFPLTAIVLSLIATVSIASVLLLRKR
jgi:hypothetical protein